MKPPERSGLNLLNVQVLTGPNIWASSPAIEVTLDLGEWQQRPPCPLPEYARRLCGSFPDMPRRIDTLAHALELIILALHAVAGFPSLFGLVKETRTGGIYKVVFECLDEGLARECLNAALEMCVALTGDEHLDPAPFIARVREAASLNMLGPSTRCIVDAAVRRGIPFTRLDRCSLVQLGHGNKQRRIRAAETDPTKAVAEGIAQDKQLTRQLLQSIGVPTPIGYAVTSADEAWETALYIGVPVVVKPRDGNQGRGVAVNLATRDQVVAGYENALKEGAAAIVEKYAEGGDYRLLVVNGKMIAAARREPARVVGDGVRTIRALVEHENRDPRRADYHANVLSKMVLDDGALQVLASQGCTPESVPSAGEKVLIRRNANLSTGGTATDVTESVHPEVAAHAVAAASVVGLDVAGIDVVALDISRPLEGQEGVVVEVNAAPGLRMHTAPSTGRQRPVGDAIIDMLFRPGDDGRIPIAAVTGTNGKSTVAHFLAHILRGTGAYVGLACTDGIYLNGRRIFEEDCSGPLSAGLLLRNPQVQMAVCETARGGILRAGLGFDRCQVAVVTNIADGDHLGQNGVETAEELARVKRTIVNAVSRDGAAVVNADDPLVTAMAQHCPGRVVYFSLNGSSRVIARHCSEGGSAIFVRAGAVVLAGPAGEQELITLNRIPLTFGGSIRFEVENALATLGAAWALGIDPAVMVERAMSFAATLDCVPGRMNVLHMRGGTVLVDYGHNAAALRAMTEVLDLFPHCRRSTVYTMAGDRRDSDIVQVAEMLGDAFDDVTIYEACTSRGRAPREIGALLRQGLSRGRRVSQIREIDDPLAAMKYALDKLEPGDLLLLQPNKIHEAVGFVREYMHAMQVADAVTPAQLPHHQAKPLRSWAGHD